MNVEGSSPSSSTKNGVPDKMNHISDHLIKTLRLKASREILNNDFSELERARNSEIFLAREVCNELEIPYNIGKNYE